MDDELQTLKNIREKNEKRTIQTKINYYMKLYKDIKGLKETFEICLKEFGENDNSVITIGNQMIETFKDMRKTKRELTRLGIEIVTETDDSSNLIENEIISILSTKEEFGSRIKKLEPAIRECCRKILTDENGMPKVKKVKDDENEKFNCNQYFEGKRKLDER